MALPWVKLLLFTPQIIDLSRDLLKRTRGKAAAGNAVAPAAVNDIVDLTPRVAALEENEARQAELVERMATQQSELAAAVVTLHRRQRWLIIAIVVLAALLAWQVLRT